MQQLPVIAPLDEPFPDVQRIAVLRGGGLGDLLFAVPAMQALAAAYPAAEITLLGSRGVSELMTGRPGSPHRVVVLPEIPGVGAPPDAHVDAGAVERFMAEQGRRNYDLAVQVHGGGRYSNPLILALGAKHSVGTSTVDAAPLERNLDYVYYQHEVLRALEVAGLAGAAPVALEPELPVRPQERAAGEQICSGTRPVVAVHPGATDPRRRWPVTAFAEVVVGLVERGVRVLLVGDRGDADRCGRLRELVRSRAGSTADDLLADLSGRLTLPELVGVLSAADTMLGNDSGPRHLAQAVGTPTVSIYWFGNALNAGPLGRGRHRVHISWVTRCPECGRDCTQVGWTAERCEHDPSFVAEVSATPVLEDVQALLDASTA